MNIKYRAIALISVLCLIFNVSVFGEELLEENQTENTTETTTETASDSFYDQSWDLWYDWNTWDDYQNYIQALKDGTSLSFGEELSEKNILLDLGAVSQNINMTDMATRSAFAKGLAAICNLGEDVAVQYGAYSDVTEATQDGDSIMRLYTFGLSQGYEDGTFRPDENITCDEAIGMLLNALGYSVVPEYKSGNYSSVSIYYKLIENISVSGSEYITNTDMINMLYNALDCDVLVQNIQSNRYGQTYTSTKDVDMIGYYFNAYSIKGIITADSYTSIDGGSLADIGTVKIDDMLYNVGTSSAQKYVGYFVKAYVKNDSDGETIIFAMPYKSNSVKLLGSSIEDIKEDFSEISYEADDKIRSLKIDKDPYVVFNGRYVRSYDREMLMPDTGELVLIDNNNDSRYDVILVTSCNDYVVRSVNSTNYTVSQKYASQLIDIDPDNYSRVMYIMNGSEATFNNISEGDTLSIAVSNDEELVTVYISKQTAIGSVSSYNSSNETVIIGADEYKFCADFLRIKEEGTQDQSGADTIYPTIVGSEGTFHLNYQNDIAGITYSSVSGMKYGYLSRFTTDEDGNFAFRIFDEEGKFENYIISERIYIDGVKYNYNGEEEQLNTIVNAIKNPPQSRVYPSIGEYDQLIRFSANSLGRIIKIDTEYYNPLTEDENLLEVTMSDRDKTYVTKILDGMKYDEFFIIPETVPVFSIPSNLYDEKAFKIERSTDLTGRPTLYGFGVDKCLAQAVIHYGGGASMGEVAYPVLKIIDALAVDSMGDESISKAVIIAKGNEEVTLVVDPMKLEQIFDPEDKVNGDLKVGDVIRYAESGGFLTTIYKPLDWQSAPDNGERTMGTDYHYDHRFVYGGVTEVTGNKYGSIELITQGPISAPTAKEWHTLATITSYVKFNKRTGKAEIINEPIDPNQLLLDSNPNTRLFLYTRYTETRMAMVIVDE